MLELFADSLPMEYKVKETHEEYELSLHANGTPRAGRGKRYSRITIKIILKGASNVGVNMGKYEFGGEIGWRYRKKRP